MKIKIIGKSGVLLAIASALSLLTSFNVSAEATMYGDINSDGTVGMTDIVYINKFLFGKLHVENLDNADLNCNGIISTVDYSILIDYILHTVKELPYTGN